MPDINWAKVKRKQAREAEHTGEVAAGVGEHGIANACYRLQDLLTRQAKEIEDEGSDEANAL